MNIFDKVPNVDKDAFVAPSASIIGDVEVGSRSSVWYGCVLRGRPRFYHKISVQYIKFHFFCYHNVNSQRVSINSCLKRDKFLQSVFSALLNDYLLFNL